MITPYNSNIDRIWWILKVNEFEEYRNKMPEFNYDWDFFTTMSLWFKKIKLAWIKVVWQNENSEYNYIILWAKNSYLSIVVANSENVIYSYSVFNSKDVINSILIESCENIYYSRCITKSSNIYYSSSIESSNNIYFCSNMIWCSFCFGCDWLSNSSYFINNIGVGKDEYNKRIKTLLEKKEDFTTYHKNTLSKKWRNIWENIKWQFNRLSNNIENSYFNYQLQNARNVVFCNASETIKNIVDCCSLGWLQSDNVYGSMWVWYNSHNVYFSVECSPSCSNIYYSYLMESCSYCLWCIWLKNKSFCILNKQYTKEERYEKANEIFQQMDSEGTLGQFFPWWMNPFYFNDTAAYLIDDSFTKEEVTAQWYLRRDDEIKVDIPTWADIISAHKVENQKSLEDFEWYNENWERTINPEILKKVIIDSKWNAYRIVPIELEFLQKHWLPLPEIHWLDRMKLSFTFE